MDWNNLLITGAILSVIIIARYFAIAGFFYWILWKCPGNPLKAHKLTDIVPPAKLIRSEIRWSLSASVIYAIPAAIVIEAWKIGGTALYSDVGDYGWPYFFLSILLYLFIHDTYFYWTHRLMHRPPIFRVLHKVHHESRQPTPWAGFSFHPWSPLLAQ